MFQPHRESAISQLSFGDDHQHQHHHHHHHHQPQPQQANLAKISPALLTNTAVSSFRFSPPTPNVSPKTIVPQYNRSTKLSGQLGYSLANGDASADRIGSNDSLPSQSTSTVPEFNLDNSNKQRSNLSRDREGSGGKDDDLAFLNRPEFELMSNTLASLRPDAQTRLVLYWIDNYFSIQQVSSIQEHLAPKLKKDFLANLPHEVALKVLSYLDDPRTLARASRVSRQWYRILNDDFTWKRLCEKHRFRRLSSILLEKHSAARAASLAAAAACSTPGPTLHAPLSDVSRNEDTEDDITLDGTNSVNSSSSLANMASSSNITAGITRGTSQLRGDSQMLVDDEVTRSEPQAEYHSYKKHFQYRYLLNVAWRSRGMYSLERISGGFSTVVTAMMLLKDYVVISLEGPQIQAYSTSSGKYVRSFVGHRLGVWALHTYDKNAKTFASGSCDRDIRLWNVETGECLQVYSGHTSTVRCLWYANPNKIISGSRDHTARIWNAQTGECEYLLLGHRNSVRCIAGFKDIIVTGSYDTTARIWNINTAQCLRVLDGHIGQIYDIAFDGKYICVGSFNSNIRVWDIEGNTMAVLQGNTSLVGQLQLKYPILVSGGSDGWVRVWDLTKFTCTFRIAAHDSCVTSVQFNDHYIVSGGRDGRVTLWDIKTGYLIRELVEQGEEVWQLAFNDEKIFLATTRHNKLYFEMIDFAQDFHGLESTKTNEAVMI